MSPIVAVLVSLTVIAESSWKIRRVDAFISSLRQTLAVCDDPESIDSVNDILDLTLTRRDDLDLLDRAAFRAEYFVSSFWEKEIERRALKLLNIESAIDMLLVASNSCRSIAEAAASEDIDPEDSLYIRNVAANVVYVTEVVVDDLRHIPVTRMDPLLSLILDFINRGSYCLPRFNHNLLMIEESIFRASMARDALFTAVNHGYSQLQITNAKKESMITPIADEDSDVGDTADLNALD